MTPRSSISRTVSHPYPSMRTLPSRLTRVTSADSICSDSGTPGIGGRLRAIIPASIFIHSLRLSSSSTPANHAIATAAQQCPMSGNNVRSLGPSITRNTNASIGAATIPQMTNAARQTIESPSRSVILENVHSARQSQFRKLVAVVMLAAISLHADTIWVEANGLWTGERGNSAKPFSNIGRAFAAAQPGDVIRIGPGQYKRIPNEVQISKSLTVMAAQSTYAQARQENNATDFHT